MYHLEQAEGGAWELVFSPFHEGRTYRVQARDDLAAASWQDIPAPAPDRLESVEGVVVLPNPDSLDRAFYRLAMELGN